MNHFNGVSASARLLARSPRHRQFLRWLAPAGAAIVLCLTHVAGFGQVAPTLGQLVATRGSLVAGDVTITNFRTPFEWPLVFADGPQIPDRGDRTSVTATLRPDGNVDLVFTAIDPLTGAPSPQVSATNAPNDFLAFVTYDVVVTNPQRALHAASFAFGPASTGNVNSIHFAYTGPQTGSLFGTQLFVFAVTPGVPQGPAGLPLTLDGVGRPLTTADFRGARLGHQWWISAFRFGVGAIASADALTVTLITAPAVPAAPGATPRIEGMHADSIFLTAPAGPGGAAVALSSASPLQLFVPASVTVPAGSTYASWPVSTSNPTQAVRFATAVTGKLGTDIAQGTYFVFPDIWPTTRGLPVLSIVKLGTGKGTVAGAGLSCGSKCSQNIQAGFTFSFSAQPASGSVFSGWQGPCIGSLAPTCNVTTTNADQVVTASFDAVVSPGGGGGGGVPTFTLSVGRSNPGTVTSDVAGITCGNTCSAKFAQSTAVSLTATPPPGKSFVNWGGACSGTAAVCSLTVNANTSVQANFSK